MIDGRIVRVRKRVSGGAGNYVVTLTDSTGVVVWASEAVGKDRAVETLLEIGLPSHRIAGKFEEAEAACAAEESAA